MNVFGNRLVTIAKSQVGVMEEPPDSNMGKRVEEYQATTWLDGTGWPYCAAFVCWCVKEAREMGEEEYGWRRPETPGAWNFENWAWNQAGNGVELFKPPAIIQPGDILVYTFSHIGICAGMDEDNKVPAIEGNTNEAGSREGGGVFNKIRLRRKIRSVIRIT